MLAPSRGTHTYWADKDPVIYEGVIGLTKDRLFPGSLEYFIGDGVHKYSELPKYGGAEASVTSKANTLVLRDADGKISMDSITLPDATPTTKGVVKASTTKAGDNVVKADDNGGLGGWKDAISDAIANPNAGLVKNSDGTLGVDFDQMPTDKFEALLKSLKMLIPLTGNMDLYVDKTHANAGDTIVDGRGTQAMPFKTIQACVNFVTETYSIGRYTVTIHVANATYTESVSLPDYSRTSGIIIIESSNYSNPATVTNASGTASVFTSIGGYWRLRCLNINGSFATGSDTLPHEPSCVEARDGAVFVSGCSVSAVCTNYDGRLDIYVFKASGGKLAVQNMADYQTSITCNRNGAPIMVLCADRGGSLTLAAGYIADQTDSYIIPCSGTMSIFAYAFRNSSIGYEQLGSPPLSFSGTMTGKKYEAKDSSSISTNTTGFPGDTEGTVETATFCWYKQASES